MIKTQGLNKMLPLLEAILSKVKSQKAKSGKRAFALSRDCLIGKRLV